MEHFFRNNQRKLVFGVAVFLLNSSLVCAGEKQAALSNVSSSATLDFANGLYARKMYGPAIAEYEKFLRQYPNSPDASSARFRYADSFYFTKDYASAIAHFEIFLENFPLDKRIPIALFRLGTARYYQGDTSRAIQTFLKLREAEDPVIRAGSLFYVAKCIEKKGQEQRSLEIYQNLIKDNANNEYAAYAGVSLGDYYIEKKNFVEALTGYQAAANNTEPKELTRMARFKVAEIQFSQKNYTEAAAYYEKVLADPIARTARDHSLSDKALLGLFYCDYNKADLASAEKRYTQYKESIVSSASGPDISFLLASLRADQKKYDEATVMLDEILASRQADEQLKEKAQYKKIWTLSQRGQKDKSLKELENYFSSGSAHADKALFEKAQLLSEIGRFDEAIVSYEKVIQEYPDSVYAKNALFQSGAVRLQTGQVDKAREIFSRFAVRYALDPSADMALLHVIQIDLDAKKFHQAFKTTENFIRTHTSSPYIDVAYYKLGVASAALKRFGHASFAFRKVSENYPSSKLVVEALYGAAVSLENAMHLDDAIKLYEKLIHDHPEHALAREQMKRMGYLYIQAGEGDKAVTFYENVIFDHPDIVLDTDGIFWLMQYLLDKHDYATLSKIVDALPARFPGKDFNHEENFYRGEIAMGLGDYAKAVLHYSSAIESDPNGEFISHAYLGRGIAYAAMAQDDEARTNFNEALKFDHNIKIAMRARFESANLYLKTKDLESAAKTFMMVAILYDDPKYTPPALFKAAECFEALGKTQDAEKAFLELRTKYPDSKWAQKPRQINESI